MKELAVCVTNDNYGCTPYETIDAIKNAGFKNVFIQWYDKDLEISQLEQYKYIKKLGLNIIFAHLGYKDLNNIWLDGELGEELVKKYFRNIDEMKELGINMVVMHLSDGFDAPDISKIGLNRYKRIIDYAIKNNIQIAFENTKKGGYQEKIIKIISDKHIGICFDCAHCHCHFKDKYDFNQFDNRILCVHIHDNHGEYDEHLLPYDGTVDYDWVFNNLNNAKYNGYLTLEVCLRKSYEDISVQEFYDKAYDVGNKLLKKYGGKK